MFGSGTSPLAVFALLAAGLMVAVFGGLSATNSARTRIAHAEATPAKVAPAKATPASTTIASAKSPALDASSGKATVTATEFGFSTAAIDAPAGKLQVTLHNAGSVPHEFVLLKTSADAGSLKVADNGRVSESASVGEVSEIKSGVSSSTTFDLKPGRYVYVCNIPGHYASGMHGVLVVK
jgi:uncharacterized cupredoxin-like copper-binding protein